MMRRVFGATGGGVDVDPLIAEIGPIDPDVALVADYLARQATPEQVAEFERRFVEDDAFYGKAALLMKIWDITADGRSLMARPPMELPAERRERERRERAAAAVQAVAAENAVSSTVVAPPVPNPRIAREPVESMTDADRLSARRYRRVRRYVNWTFKVAMAASLLVTAGFQLYLYFGDRRAEVALARAALQRHEDAVAAATHSTNAPATATILPGAPRGAAPRPKTPLADTTRAGASDTPDTLKTQNDLFKATVAAFGASYRTGDGETKVFEFDNGVRVRLRPNTTLRLMPIMVPMRSRPIIVDLEGEIAVDFPLAGLAAIPSFDVIGRTGHVSAMPSWEHDGTRNVPVHTSFAARCLPGCTEIEVAVAEGTVQIFPATNPERFVSVDRGEFGLLPASGRPVLVDASKAKDFPRPDPSIRKAP